MNIRFSLAAFPLPFLLIYGFVSVARATFSPLLPEPKSLPMLRGHISGVKAQTSIPFLFPKRADIRAKGSKTLIHLNGNDFSLVLAIATARNPGQLTVKNLTADTPLKAHDSARIFQGSDYLLIGLLDGDATVQTCATPTAVGISNADLKLSTKERRPSLSTFLGLTPQAVPSCLLVSLSFAAPRTAKKLSHDDKAQVIQAWSHLRRSIIAETSLLSK